MSVRLKKVQVELEIPWNTEVSRVVFDSMNFMITPLGAVACYSNFKLQLKPDWEWPKWLTAPWIAMDSDGNWCWFSHEPCKDERGWWYKVVIGSDAGYLYMANKIGELGHHPPFDFTPPPCDDWKLSKRKNPNLVD